MKATSLAIIAVLLFPLVSLAEPPSPTAEKVRDAAAFAGGASVIFTAVAAEQIKAAEKAEAELTRDFRRNTIMTRTGEVHLDYRLSETAQRARAAHHLNAAVDASVQASAELRRRANELLHSGATFKAGAEGAAAQAEYQRLIAEANSHVGSAGQAVILQAEIRSGHAPIIAAPQQHVVLKGGGKEVVAAMGALESEGFEILNVKIFEKSLKARVGELKKTGLVLAAGAVMTSLVALGASAYDLVDDGFGGGNGARASERQAKSADREMASATVSPSHGRPASPSGNAR